MKSTMYHGNYGVVSIEQLAGRSAVQKYLDQRANETLKWTLWTLFRERRLDVLAESRDYGAINLLVAEPPRASPTLPTLHG